MTTFDEALHLYADHIFATLQSNQHFTTGDFDRLGIPERAKPYIIRNVTFEEPYFDRYGGCPSCDYGNASHNGQLTINWSYGTQGRGKARTYTYTVDDLENFLRDLFNLTEPQED